MSLACDSCSKIIRDDSLDRMITLHVPDIKQRGGQAFLYQVEKIMCSPACVITDMLVMQASVALAGEQRAE